MTPAVEQIIEAAREQGLSPSVLADKCGLERSTVCRIFKGEREPKEATLLVMRLALGTFAEQIANGDLSLVKAERDAYRKSLDEAKAENKILAAEIVRLRKKLDRINRTSAL